MKIAVKLKKPLPQDQIAQRLHDVGLIPEGNRDIVRFPYIDQTETLEDEKIPQWKAAYCNWTHLGWWLSEECYDALEKNNALNSKSTRERKKKIEILRNNGNNKSWKEERKSTFIRIMKNAWMSLRNADLSPEEFLKTKNGKIDIASYENVFDDKFKADFLQARDHIFYNRYVTGYEFVNVPRFKSDKIAWNQFVLSWCESIVFEANKRNTRSLLTNHIRSAIGPVSAEFLKFGPENIRDKLRACWNAVEKGDVVWAQFSNGRSYRAHITRKFGDGTFEVKYVSDHHVETLSSDKISTIGKVITLYFDREKSYDFEA